jgi:carboxymethylenebutenolidase
MRITLTTGTPAELALPEGEVARGLVLIPDIGGLRPLFDDLCARLASENGWVVCAPEPFPGREDLQLADRMNAMAGLDDATQLADVTAAAAVVAERGASPVAVLGFCMGGMYALKAAGSGVFDRAVAFYGMIHLPPAWEGPGQGDPLAAATAPGASPVLAVVGTEDPYTPPDHVGELEAAGATVARYEGAEHGFVHDPSRPAHRAADAADAWERVRAFLAP